MTTLAVATVIEQRLSVPIFDQWDSVVDPSYRSSACGPTTMAAITEYWRLNKGKSNLWGMQSFWAKGSMINHFYSSHGGAAYGMSVSSLKGGLKAHASDDGYVSVTGDATSYTAYRGEINNGRPLAVKFDSYTTFFEPDHNYAYAYHWVVGVGYAYDTFDSLIIIHDNDGSTFSSQEKYFDYATNSPILSAVTFNIS
ncbi:C39 family peptidase [Paenibacillus pasadenensis]|uniref:C39 family peptidase n=1 Tax=Paenibacillus pasadenensis TaxID=217090 RepID=UPI00203C4283|nr:C39 family peptidase [Paenibacillus pasadenensis]